MLTTMAGAGVGASKAIYQPTGQEGGNKCSPQSHPLAAEEGV